MKRHHRTLLNHTSILALLMTVSLLCSCKDSLYASFLIPEKGTDLTEIRNGVELHLRLNPLSLLEDELEIINNSKDTVYINPKEIFFFVSGRDIKIPLVDDYDAYIMKMNSKATLLCNEATFPYKCVDAVTNTNNGFKGKGFIFYAIYPRKARKGYIAFDFPTPLNDTPIKDALMVEFERNYKTLRGTVNIELIIGNKVETIQFPIEIGLSDNINKTSLEIKSLLK